MMNKYYLISAFLAVFVFIVTACGPTNEVSVEPTEVHSTTLEPTVTFTPTPDITPTETTVPLTEDVISYAVTAELDRVTMVLSASEEITFTNGRTQPVDHVRLVVLPSTYPNGFVLNSLTVDNVELPFVMEGEELWIPDVTVPYGSTIEIRIDFELLIPRVEQGDPSIIRPQIYGFTDRQINLIDWFPMLTARDANGDWLINPLGYYGENMVYPLSSGFISLTIADNAPIPVTAASGDVSVSERTLIYKFSNYRDFAIMLSDPMLFVEGETNGIVIRSFYFPGYEAGGKAVLDATRDAVNLYTEKFGPIDNVLISAVQGDFDDGMEYEGLYYLSNSFYNLYDGEADQYLILVAAHETCHQWFFGNVASDQAKEPWLDESLATYCEKLFYETYYPQYLDWWWAARIDFYQPEGVIDDDIYSYQGFSPYTNAVYRRGAKYYEDLRNLIGDEAFFAFLKDYYASLNGKMATSSDHFTILRRHTDVDLTPLIQEYFGTPR